MPEASLRDRPADEGNSRTARVHVFEESDSGTVPMNHSNKSEKPPAESEKGRPLIKENTRQSSTHSTQSEARVSQGLAGVRKAARERKEMKFTALLHHLTVTLLRDSFYALKRKGCSGGGRRHVAGVRSRVGRSARRSAQPGSPRRFSSAAIEKGVHSETGRTATAARGCGAGGQDCSTGRGHHPQPDLRGRFSGFLIWLPARAQPASSAGCAVRRDHAEEGELDFGL